MPRHPIEDPQSGHVPNLVEYIRQMKKVSSLGLRFRDISTDYVLCETSVEYEISERYLNAQKHTNILPVIDDREV
jgi:hypothetical protein